MSCLFGPYDGPLHRIGEGKEKSSKIAFFHTNNSIIVFLCRGKEKKTYTRKETNSLFEIS